MLQIEPFDLARIHRSPRLEVTGITASGVTGYVTEWTTTLMLNLAPKDSLVERQGKEAT